MAATPWQRQVRRRLSGAVFNCFVSKDPPCFAPTHFARRFIGVILLDHYF